MNDFVAGVIQQMLQNTEKPQSVCTSPASPPAEEVHRPNYQREKAKTQIPARQIAPVIAPVAEPFSELRQVLLKAQNEQLSPAFEKNGGSPAMRAASRTAVLEKADRRIAALLGVRFSPELSVGIAWQPNAGIESLLAADNVLYEFPSLDGRIRWREEGTEFLLALSGDTREVSAAIAAFVKEEKNSSGIVICHHPSAYLQRRIKVDRRLPVGAFGGISYPEALSAANGYYVSHPQSTVEFYPGGGYLAAQGDPEEITSVLKELRAALGAKGVIG